MDIYDIRKEMKTKSIFNINLRVTFYARVSSESDEQLNSLGNQISYYKDFIQKNPAWTYVDGYIDEGISGISTKKRENFNRMIEDAKNGLFDLIITKEISRFARNTLDSLQFTRELLRCGVGVFFQNDNINTLNEDSEFYLSMMSSIAQDELRKLSSRVKFGHQQAIKSKVVLGNSNIFGYRKDSKKLVIDEAEAEMVRELYQLYSTGEYSLKQIENIFYDRGYRNRKGNKIMHNTMSGIISNPKYKGYYVGNKVKVVDMFTKKQKFLPPEEWVMFKDETGEIVPAIVTEELWERANEILRRRSEDVKGRQGICNHANLLTGKLYCTCCGEAYYRRESKDKKGKVNSKWVCSGKIKNGASSCPSFAIYEDEIKPILFDVLSDTKADAEALAEEYIQMYRSLESDGNLQKQIDAQNKIVTVAEMKKSKLLEHNAAGKLSDSDFISMIGECNKDIKAAEEKIKELEAEMMSNKEFEEHLNEIRKALKCAQDAAADGLITNEFVSRYIDKIFVTPTGKGEAKLDIKIFTGKDTEKYLRKLENRVGQITESSAAPQKALKISQNDPKSSQNLTHVSVGPTFKKMIESYENSIKTK